MQEQFWEILWRSVASGEQAGAWEGDRSLWLTQPLEELAVSIPPQRFQVGCMGCGSALGGWAHLEQDLPSPVLGGESWCSPPLGFLGYGQEINNKPNWRSNTAYQESQGLPSASPLYLCCPDISLQWKRADWGTGKPRCAWQVGLAGDPVEALFLCSGLQVTPGPLPFTMQIQKKNRVYTPRKLSALKLVFKFVCVCVFACWVFLSVQDFLV